MFDLESLDWKWKLAIAFGVLLLSYLFAKILLWFTDRILKARAAKTKTKLDDILIDKLEEPVAYSLALGGFYWSIHFLVLGKQSVEDFLHKLCAFVLILNVTWMIARTVDALIEAYVIPATEKTESEFDDQLVPILQKGVRAVIWILGVVLALDNMDFDIGAMIAGLGIGGLALALAAQDAVKNIFGGIMIFLDKPFKINERVQIHGFDGIVEEVGLRSTRIRTLEGRLVTMPNSIFMENEVVNVSSEPSRKVLLNLGMTYDTTPENMQLAIDTLKGIVDANQDKILLDSPIGFNAFGDFAMGIVFIYYIKAGEDNLAVQTQINMQILNEFNAKGLEFAFPTQTLYTKSE